MGLDQNIMKRKANGKVENVMYWRKANFIHQYFTEDFFERGYGDDNCTEFPIDLHDIKRLRDRCKVVLEKHDAEVCDEVLPTVCGFFFGSTTYDDLYYEDVQITLDFCEKLLEEGLEDGDALFYYAWY